MKLKTLYVCQNCGSQSPKWAGRCSNCSTWNSMVEEVVEKKSAATSILSKNLRTQLETLEEVPNQEKKRSFRYSTGIGELDRVLGGGLVRDSFVLLGGDPGIGKSTLLLQMAGGLSSAKSESGEILKILYFSGEESVEQVRTRSFRLGIKNKANVFLGSETNLNTVLETITEMNPHVVVIDSLQTFSSSDLESAPGSVSQVREVATKLMHLAKSQGIAVLLVGHVTKDGMIAGPKVVEHLVDTVLHFEGEQGYQHRLLRAVKNRFGNTNELGVFEMDEAGLQEVKNPSALFLSERNEAVSGVAVTVSLEGTRPLLVEIQSLVSKTAYAVPRRTAVGLDSNRLALLAAIVEKHLSLNLGDRDLFFNVVGGMKLTETASDLGGVAAIWSSVMNRAIAKDLIFIGEVGLTGEVRSVSQLQNRLDEAQKLGFQSAVIPANAVARSRVSTKLTLHPVSKISELAKIL